MYSLVGIGLTATLGTANVVYRCRCICNGKCHHCRLMVNTTITADANVHLIGDQLTTTVDANATLIGFEITC
jgi:hypothetical protein